MKIEIGWVLAATLIILGLLAWTPKCDLECQTPKSAELPFGAGQ